MLFVKYQLVLILSSTLQVVKTWSTKKSSQSQKPGLVQSITVRVKNALSLKIIIMWTVWLLLIWYIQAAGKPAAGFDPFAILQLPEDASEQDIKKAYRKLSLQYHPDKNPDPAAAEYFANSITKAYKALTDETARENYRKYGHPDGQQALTVSVALPEWFFSKEKEMAPVILLSLLFGGIVLPLGLASCYLSRSNKYTGPNEVMIESVQRYWHPRFGVKESQGVGKMLDTLVWAQEFQDLPMSPDQAVALSDLRRDLIVNHPDLKDKNGVFWKRQPGFVKAHMLLLAYMDRETVDVRLQKDLNFVLQKSPKLLQELFQIASFPQRIKPAYGWMTPAVACIEMMQCLVQAVPADEKKKHAFGKSAESVTSLLQLPHFDAELVKKLARKKIKTLADLQALNLQGRRVALQSSGLTGSECEDVEVMLSALPTVWVSAQLVVEGPDGQEESAAGPVDLVTCRCQVMLTRPSHMAPGFDPDTIKGKAARAYAPRYPFPREENWFFIVADVANNALMGWTRQPLLQAEAIGARYAANWVSKNTASAVSKLDGALNTAVQGNPLLAGTKFDPFTTGVQNGDLSVDGHSLSGGGADSLDASLEELGQTVEVKFLAPMTPGKHDLTLIVMPDSWLGADKTMTLRLRVDTTSRVQQAAENMETASSSQSGLSGKKGNLKKKAAAGAAAARKQQRDDLQRSEESEIMLEGDGEEDEESDAGDGYSDDDDVEEEEGLLSDEEEEDEHEEHDYDSEEYGTEESEDEGEAVVAPTAVPLS